MVSKMTSALSYRVLFAAVLVLVLGSAARAADTPEITKADVNLDTATVTITGYNFGALAGRVALIGSRGTVEAECVVESWSDDVVVAHLPSGLAPATYRIGLATHGSGVNGAGASRSDRIDVSVIPHIAGAAGPQGPAGPAGPEGPQGQTGPQGATG